MTNPDDQTHHRNRCAADAETSHRQHLTTFYIPGVELCIVMNKASVVLAVLGVPHQPEPPGMRIVGGLLLSLTLFLLRRRAEAQ